MGTFTFIQDGGKRSGSDSFYRGENVNYYPTDLSIQQSSFVEDYLMSGLKPESPFITKQTAIVAFGSCFAANASNYLNRRGYNVLTRHGNNAHVTRVGDGMVHTHAILEQLQWAWEEKRPSGEYWHGYQAAEFGADEETRLQTKNLFDAADVFILTLGLSEIWYDEPTGDVFWRAVPKSKYDPARHKFRVASFEETKSNIKAIRALILKHRPSAHVVLSVSPIPLNATFRDIPCMAADAASKAIIRAALDEALREMNDKLLHYMPSYEIVTRVFSHQWNTDRRHVERQILDFNMAVFEKYYCKPGLPADDLAAAWKTALGHDNFIRLHGHPDDGFTYEEIHQMRLEDKRESRRQARIRHRAAEREKLRQIRIDERSGVSRSQPATPPLRKNKSWPRDVLQAVLTLFAVLGLWNIVTLLVPSFLD